MDSAMPSNTVNLLETLRGWVDAGALRALDLALTRFVARKGAEADDAVLLAIALTSERNGHGHVCLDLQGALTNPQALLGRLRDDREISLRVQDALAAQLRKLSLPNWVERLAASPVISDWLGAGADDGVSPLVLAGHDAQPLLYLRRYWAYENRIRAGIRARLSDHIRVDTAVLRTQLDALFAPQDGATPAQPDWQRIACALAARSAFFIITGGPGTGKTTTVVRLLALLQGIAADADAPVLRIELAAPTGKAAARLNESITDQVRNLAGHQAPEASIPTRVKTLHRLLGTIPDSRQFRHHAAHPLPADVVVVDEASMVDVEMMARLLEAMRPDTRLILLGDKDQLSSVEAGAVLGDLCQRAARAHYRPETADWLQQASGQAIPVDFIDAGGTELDQAVVMLRKSYRFSEDGGIGALAALVNDAAPPAANAANRLGAALALFAHEQTPHRRDLGTIRALRLTETADAGFSRLMREGYGGENSYLQVMWNNAPADTADQAALDAWAKQVLEAQKRFQLLTPLREGVRGVEGLNQRIVELLHAQLLPEPALGTASSRRHWFPGRPVLMTRNDYSLNLMNGDIGVTLKVPVGGDNAAPDLSRQALRVAFPTADGGVRWVLPSRLQTVETVFAMTVHKSQGSEFTHTVLILPDKPNPVLTRELVYTAITRAKQQFTLLYSDDSVLGEALKRRVQRVSGLREV
ncbi:exodeoxyribonuclease V subunit alpha [Thiohalocapsa marina]|uniref:exodeoxyribonuclease V subunit alpha n=1 Tax=Thiohalocapsa marina TaxID=424902 RepID=UPI0036DE575F